MSERFRLFVYGQLRRGQIGHQRLGLEQRTDWLGPARIHGRLYDFGDYPGLILGGDGIVHGEVLAFADPALWTVLDAYEDYDPERSEASEYRRVEVELLGGAGRAWTYEYNRSVEDRPLIVSGVWRAGQDHAKSRS